MKLLNERCESDVSAWNNLQTELATIGSIVDSVDSLRAEMEALCGQLEHLDIALDDHLKAKEQRDLLRWKRDISRDTENFQTSRARELTNFERTLKAEQSKRIRQKAEETARVMKETELLKRKEAKARLEEEQRKSAIEKAKTLEASENSKEVTLSSAVEPENTPSQEAEIKTEDVKKSSADENELEVNDEVLTALEEKGKDS